MFIYVDKKKEKKRKIRIISLILLGFFIICANVIYFKIDLNKTSEHLTDYQSIKHSNSWFLNSEIVYLFSAPKPNIKKVILTPSKINRETTTVMVSILLKLKKQKTYQILPDILDKKSLTQLINKVLPQVDVTEDNPDIIISSDFSKISDIIDQNQMIPLALSYKTAEKKLSLEQLSKYVTPFFPLKELPKNKMEEEKQALEIFVEDNISSLKNFSKIDFSKQNLFLRNARICLVNQNSDTFCSLSNHSSFLHNLKKALVQAPADIPLKKIIFLTSDDSLNPEEINELKADEGLRFQYQKRKSILLPEEMTSLTNSKQKLYKLKQKAGLNPQYENPYMKYYKFKTLEVNLDDNI